MTGSDEYREQCKHDHSWPSDKVSITLILEHHDAYVALSSRIRVLIDTASSPAYISCSILLIYKLCNNLCLAVSMIGVSEAMSLGSKMGMDPKVRRSADCNTPCGGM